MSDIDHIANSDTVFNNCISENTSNKDGSGSDIDIIAYDSLTLADDTLTLPHPRLFERAFVLVPLAEIAGDRIIAGRRVSDAATAIDSGGIERLPAAV